VYISSADPKALNKIARKMTTPLRKKEEVTGSTSALCPSHQLTKVVEHGPDDQSNHKVADEL
jgi:hypothetical protein